MSFVQQSEERGKVEQEAIETIRRSTERFQNRLTTRNLRFAERYLEGELHLLIYFRVRGRDEELIASFEGTQFVGWSDADIKAWKVPLPSDRFEALRKSPAHRRPDVDAAEGGPYCDEQAVLVDVVQAINEPERVIPTRVRFGRDDRVERSLAGALYFSSREGLKTLGRWREREGDIAGFGVGRISPEASTNQLEGEVVERAAQVMEHVPGNHADNRGDILSARDVIDQLACLRIALGCDEIRLGVVKAAQFQLELSDMRFGPFQLRRGAV